MATASFALGRVFCVATHPLSSGVFGHASSILDDISFSLDTEIEGAGLA